MDAFGAWQESHYHKEIFETYIVEIGSIVLATDKLQKPVSFIKLLPGAIYTITPLEIHNIYMSPHSVIHTVKHNTKSETGDWHAAPQFDQVANINEDEIAKILATASG